MKIERRKNLSRREWAAITSRVPVVRRVLERGHPTRPEPDNSTHTRGE